MVFSLESRKSEGITSDWNHSPLFGQPLGISHKVSIAFRKDEWNTFAAIWQKAKRSKSDSFQFIDSYKEAPSDGYRSLLTVAVGPGVQFTINDKAGTYVFVLPPKDFFRVDADIAKVATYLGSN